MKTKFLSVVRHLPLLYIGISLLLAACSSDELSVADADDGNTDLISFTVSKPSAMQTRATSGEGSYSDGTSATTLYCAVYQFIDDTPTFMAAYSDTIEDQWGDGLSQTIDLALVSGNEYGVVFWAQSPDQQIYILDFDSSSPTISIDMDKLTSNTEEYDAFYHYEYLGTITGNSSKTITLTRPLAQLNWGTNNYEAATNAGLTDIQAELTLAGGIGTTLNLFDGSVEESTESVVFAASSPDTTQTFPVDGYEYLNMNYILFAEDKATVDAQLSIRSGSTEVRNLEVSAVPLQRNYRTNIYGSLLVGSVGYTIEINPYYEEEDNEVIVAEAEVATAAELAAALADSVSSILLTADVDTDCILYITQATTSLDLGGFALTADYIYINEGSTTVTISNGTFTAITYGIRIGGSNNVITLDGLTINSGHYGVRPGGTNSETHTDSANTVVMTNCTINSQSHGVRIFGQDNVITVENCSICTASGVNGIMQVGTYTPGSTLTVKDTYISAGLGGIFFASNDSAQYSDVTVTGCEIISASRSAIEVQKTNLTVSSSTLVSQWADQQSYSVSSDAKGCGFGVVLGGYAEGTAFEGTVSLSDITYSLASSTDMNGSSPPWFALKYSGSASEEYTDNGATSSSAYAVSQ